MKDATKRQLIILKAITEYVSKYNYPPTIRNIAAAVGPISISTVHAHLSALRKKGIIAWEPSSTRTLTILKGAEEDENRNS